MNIKKNSEINLRSYIKNVFKSELIERYRYSEIENVCANTDKNSIKIYFIEFFDFDDIYNILLLPKELINIIYEYCLFCFEVTEIECGKYNSPFYKIISCDITCKIFNFVYEYSISFDSDGKFHCIISETKNDKYIYESTPENKNIVYFFNDFMKRYYDKEQYIPILSSLYSKSTRWKNNIWTLEYRLALRGCINVVEVVNHELTTSIIHIFKIIFDIFADEVYDKYNDELQSVVKID